MLEPPCRAGHRSFVLVTAAPRPLGAPLCGVAGHHRAPSRASRSMLRQPRAIAPPYPRPSHFDGRTAVTPPSDLASSPRHARSRAPLRRTPPLPSHRAAAAGHKRRLPTFAPRGGPAPRSKGQRDTNPAVGPRLPRFCLNAQRLLGASSAADLRARRGGAALRGQQQGAISVSHPRGPDAGALDLRGRQRDRTGEVPG
ncbi:unnamed protein product [Urochloa humidicola]